MELVKLCVCQCSINTYLLTYLTVNARLYDSDVMAVQKAELSIQYSTIQYYFIKETVRTQLEHGGIRMRSKSQMWLFDQYKISSDVVDR